MFFVLPFDLFSPFFSLFFLLFCLVHMQSGLNQVQCGRPDAAVLTT